MPYISGISLLFRAALTVICLMAWGVAHAATFQLSWIDNSPDETGFQVERKLGTGGSYGVIATVGANVTTYRDTNLANSTTYCYRVAAFNNAGRSPYSPEACGTTPAATVIPPPVPAPLQQFTLNVLRGGAGSGSVSSAPSGINCGSACSASYGAGSVIALTPLAGAGSIFSGWSGAGCATGIVTLNANTTCTATFSPNPPSSSPSSPSSQSFSLSVTKSGNGNGTITSNPAGINCGSSCSTSYGAGTVVTLTTVPAAGSNFEGWSGAGCAGGSFTLNGNMTCAAIFSSQTPQTVSLSVAKSGNGSGTITSTPAGIDCGSSCSAQYSTGVQITLRAVPGPGSTFAGWNGSGCATGAVTLNNSSSCTAIFQSVGNNATVRIGVFRPDTGEWFLDRSGNGQWDNCSVDTCLTSFGQSGDLPVVGVWSGTGASNVGAFSPSSGTWRLDTNGDGVLDCASDTCFGGFGVPGDLPVVRETGNGSIVGTFTPQSVTIFKRRKIVKRGIWNFDANGNSTLDGCEVDECNSFGTVGELPIVGDWNGDGTEQIGVFLPKNGAWYLDLNGNGSFDGCRVDRCLGRFGVKGDLPVVGDWDGTGNVRIGVFRPTAGMWYLDMNGNGKVDNCSVDACLGPFGQPGDLPVVGNW